MKKELSLRVVSIDPGFNNLGVSFSNLNYHSGLMVVNDVNTYQIQKLTSRVDGSIIQYATNGLINVETVKALIGRLLDTYKPDVVICESSYMGKFPQAFVSLSLCLHAIESAVYNYDTDVGYYTFDPATIKNANGVKGGSRDKEDMRKAIIANPSIVSAKDFNLLDEHSIDSIGIGYCYFRKTFY